MVVQRKQNANNSENYEQIFNLAHNYRNIDSSKLDSVFAYIVKDFFKKPQNLIIVGSSINVFNTYVVSFCYIYQNYKVQFFWVF